jgi:hypothetical protein
MVCKLLNINGLLSLFGIYINNIWSWGRERERERERDQTIRGRLVRGRKTASSVVS